MKITQVRGREILDSRGFPALECSLDLEGGARVCAAVPSGASVGKFEAHELRDGDAKRYFGKGVLKALANLEQVIAPALVGQEPDVVVLDAVLCDIDGTAGKASLGANAILAASIAVARAQALDNGLELYDLLAQRYEFPEVSMPYCMFNIFNGGAHADNGVSVQEFMIMPINQPSFAESLRVAATVYHALHEVLKRQGLATTIGDEGGFAPKLKNLENSVQAVLDLLMQAVEYAGFSYEQVVFALDVAASQFHRATSQRYQLGTQEFDRRGLVDFYAQLASQYPLFSIEDGMDEEDWAGWKILTKELGGELQLVGDDLFVTNCDRIERGIDAHVANAVLIKPNQIGTVTETMFAIKLAQSAGYKTIVSHRSGETNDTFIADLVVATGAGQFKAGAPVRGERIAKYNRLLEIERML